MRAEADRKMLENLGKLSEKDGNGYFRFEGEEDEYRVSFTRDDRVHRLCSKLLLELQRRGKIAGYEAPKSVKGGRRSSRDISEEKVTAPGLWIGLFRRGVAKDAVVAAIEEAWERVEKEREDAQRQEFLELASRLGVSREDAEALLPSE